MLGLQACDAILKVIKALGAFAGGWTKDIQSHRYAIYGENNFLLVPEAQPTPETDLTGNPDWKALALF